jgi:hypothetical protein
MKPSEILRSLADMIDARQQAANPMSEPGALSPSIEPAIEVEPEHEDNGLAHQPDDIFVPPLQLKIELLKRATGVDNIYADEEEEQSQANSYDELNMIRKNAGLELLNPVVLDALGDDEPLDV